MNKKFGLMGTITHDVITFESGQSFEGIGGVLYQAAVLCGLGKDVFLQTNLGEELVSEVDRIIETWSSLQREGIHRIPGPGNQVHLHYPEKGERVETLKSVVPPLDPYRIIEGMPEMEMFIFVINSGFDIELSDWRKIVAAAECPVWLDIHSLLLTRKLNSHREYLPLLEWREWVKGVNFVQANEKEVASMLGCPETMPLEDEMSRFGKMVFQLGISAVFVTLGKEGVLVMTPQESRKIVSPEVKRVVDTTGCGDVFCGAAVVKLAEGKDPFAAASFGLELATEAVSVEGIQETYLLACDYQEKKKGGGQ